MKRKCCITISLLHVLSVIVSILCAFASVLLTAPGIKRASTTHIMTRRILRNYRQSKATRFFASKQEKCSFSQIWTKFSCCQCGKSILVPSLLNHLICPLQHAGRDYQPNLLCRLKVNDELELGRLLNREISRFGTLQDLVHAASRLPVSISRRDAVVHKAALIHITLLSVDRR